MPAKPSRTVDHGQAWYTGGDNSEQERLWKAGIKRRLRGLSPTRICENLRNLRLHIAIPSRMNSSPGPNQPIRDVGWPIRRAMWRNLRKWSESLGSGGVGRRYLLTRGRLRGIVPKAAAESRPKYRLRGVLRRIGAPGISKPNLSSAGYPSLPCTDAEPTPGPGPL
jgi:hypothetical protein